tara:strand:- start:567 stop:2564 length:1998 start_codon:yes stop_codon:yes gene_type:complete
MLLAVIIAISMITFNKNDDSFLVRSSQQTQNWMGDFGSYTSSFVFYAFGAMGYLLPTFFLLYAISVLNKKIFNFFFIRIFVFFISLTLIPQSLINHEISWFYIILDNNWGNLSENLYSLYQIEYLSYLLSFIGLLLFFLSQDLLNAKNKFNFSVKKYLQKNLNKKNNIKLNKKEPVIEKNNNSNISKKSEENTFENVNDLQINNYKSPSLDILNNKNTTSSLGQLKKQLNITSQLLEKVFADFNIVIEVINIKQGPVVTLFEILPSAGTKINTIINLADDVSRSMGVGATRISQIYETQYLGVEIPNQNRETVTIKELLGSDEFSKSTSKIPICVGKDISGNIEVIDLSKTPHLLVAGTTGSGKSVFINSLICSLLYKFSPTDLRLILIDPKMLELSVYNDIAHLLTPVVIDPKKSILALKWICKEMERRYAVMNEEGTRSIESFNMKSQEKIPFIVVVIDEMADLMMTAGKEVEHYVQRLAQMARACGIHLIMATQRPSVDIITGSIKANFPSRVSFQVASKYDSRTILGEIGAEQLLGNGDMLMSKNGANIIRYQSAFISDDEVSRLIKQIKKNQNVKYLDELQDLIQKNQEDHESLSDEDEALITRSIDLIKSSNKASTSFLQRNFQIGYNKAARIMETLEKRGVVSEPNHTGKREILINNS